MTEQENREKILKEFERFMQEYDRDIGFTNYDSEVIKGVHAWLKAQEPVEYVVHCKNADLSNGIEFACGKCGGSLLHKRVNYCTWCGQAVKWE